MDRTRLVTSSPPPQDDLEYRNYDPIHPGTDWRARIRKLTGPVIAGIVALAKWSFVLVKFSSIFIAVAAYALIWGWRFATGLVFLILWHELGHYLEARREGLGPKLPVFVPLIGAYVKYTRGNPWQTARVALAGPMLGGVVSLAFLLAGEAQNSELLRALAYFGFFLNLINLVPFGPLDGGQIWKSARFLRVGGAPAKAQVVYVLYFGTAIALALGMWASHVTQHRL